jgi:hypothetical protein
MLAGLILRLATRAEKHGDHYRYNIKSGSISLGTYVFLCPAHWDSETTLKHEQGHTKQSYMLGWLFLLVVGVPSIIWAGCFNQYRAKHGISYYSFYTEKWADKLMGIER